ncbi:hypothetical protein [Planktothrix agardhii]|jgi:hypothetical protein|uniref:hypothetical protein n=1 Tax=Planktothrix agardhii TaxID=1160 RepID=UPI0020A74D87|nr:hypothetical protein [Planktothrix agardhii]
MKNIIIKISENMTNLEIEKIKRKAKASDNLSKLMDQASEEAQARGLTPEILEKILNENE